MIDVFPIQNKNVNFVLGCESVQNWNVFLFYTGSYIMQFYTCIFLGEKSVEQNHDFDV